MKSMLVSFLVLLFSISLCDAGTIVTDAEKRLIRLEGIVARQTEEIWQLNQKIKINDFDKNIPYFDLDFSCDCAKPTWMEKVGDNYFIQVSSICEWHHGCYGSGTKDKMFVTKDFHAYLRTPLKREDIKMFFK